MASTAKKTGSKKSAAKKKTAKKKTAAKKSNAKRTATKKKTASRSKVARNTSSLLEKVEGIDPVERRPNLGGEGPKRDNKSSPKKTTHRATAEPAPELDREAAPVAALHRSSFAGRVRRRDIVSFFRQLIMLVEAGTPILKALKTVAERSQRQSVRNLIQDMAEYVESGNPLWQAFERHREHFSTVEIALIKASEASGTLTEILERIASYRERHELITKRVRAAVLYPVIVLFVCYGVLVLFSFFVIPEIESMFYQLAAQMDNYEIPWYTQLVFTATDVFLPLTFAIFVVAAVLYAGYRLWWVRGPGGPARRLAADKLKLRLWIVGSVVQKTAVVDFTRTFALLQRSGLSMMNTLRLCRESVRNEAMVYVIDTVRDSVERGEGMEPPMRRAPHVIPPIVVDMLVTGEEAGSIEKISTQIADKYEEELNIELITIGETIQPIVVVVLGGIVLLGALAVFVPLVSIITAISG